MYLPSSRFENCAKIVLSTNEYTEILNNSTSVVNAPVAKLNNGEYEICISDFEAITNPKESDSMRNTAALIFYILLANVKFVI